MLFCKASSQCSVSIMGEIILGNLPHDCFWGNKMSLIELDGYSKSEALRDLYEFLYSGTFSFLSQLGFWSVARCPSFSTYGVITPWYELVCVGLRAEVCAQLKLKYLPG